MIKTKVDTPDHRRLRLHWTNQCSDYEQSYHVGHSNSISWHSHTAHAVNFSLSTTMRLLALQ